MNLIKKILKPIIRRKSKPITSFERITIRVSGMRMMTEYEILDGKSAQLSRFRIYCKNGEDIKELERSVSCNRKDILTLLGSCGVSVWNGFHGKHPKHIQDGIMFIFTAVINEGETIRADGSENFPDGYHELIRTLDKLLG